jgi:peroxiredoxin
LVDSSRRLPDGTTTDLSDGQREHVALRLRGWDEQVIRARIARCNRTLRVNVTDGFGEAAVGRFVTIRYLLDPLGFETKSLQGPEQVVPDSGMVEFTGVPTSDVAEVLLEVNGTVDLVSFDPASPAIVEHTLSLAPTIGRRAPDVTLTGAADGHPFRLSSLRGRVVLLEFWATWCGPCQPAMTRTNEMAGRRSDRGDRVAVVGVSTDDALDKVAGHVKKRNWNASLQTWGGPHVNGGSPVSRAFGIRGIPHAFLIDGGGTLRWAGHPDDVDLEKEIDRLVREAR